MVILSCFPGRFELVFWKDGKNERYKVIRGDLYRVSYNRSREEILEALFSEKISTIIIKDNIALFLSGNNILFEKTFDAFEFNSEDVISAVAKHFERPDFIIQRLEAFTEEEYPVLLNYLFSEFF